MTTLQTLRTAHEAAYADLLALIDRKFPGAAIWNWYRALLAVKGENGRRNDDTSHDVAMAADTDIKAAHDEYIRLLHVFYRARDGEHGVLGAYRQRGEA
jgi:hypothetical protein